MNWQCPKCNTEIDKLEYSVSTSQMEYGTAYLTDKETTDNHITEYNCNDNEDNNWDGDCEYECPECNANIRLKNLIWINNKENSQKKKEPEEPEETLHKIIKPINYIIDENTNKATTEDAIENSIICKKCLHIFIHDIDQTPYYLPQKNKEFAECPSCGTLNSPEEFKELLKKGVFDKIRKKKYAHQKTK